MKRFQHWRRIVRILEAVIVIGLPFITINSTSALRFDIPALQLHFFGISIWMEEFFIVLIAIFFLVFLFAFITLLYGRVWCGWVCPQTVISDLTGFLHYKEAPVLQRIFSLASVFAVSIVVAANLIWYFVSPYEFFPALINGDLGRIVWGFWLSLTAILFLNFTLIRHSFCATVCPYAKLQGVLYDDRTLVITMDPERKDECIECLACVRTCPVNIDIRKGLSNACINCAQCVDACAPVMEKRKKTSLIGYFFGLPAKTGKVLRQNAVILGAVTAIFMVFFLYLLYMRLPLDVTVLPNSSFPPRITVNGGVINSYILSIRNMGAMDMQLSVRARKGEKELKITPDRSFQLTAGQMEKRTVYISAHPGQAEKIGDEIELLIQSLHNGSITIKKTAPFNIP
jgi:cytochrome c oxidase accessory protein FixG